MNPLNLFSKITETRAYGSGEVVFRQGEPGTDLYVVRSGEVEIQSGGMTVELVGEGGILGEMPLIDASARSATAIARGDCELIPGRRERFNFLVQQTPFFAIHVMCILAERLRRTNTLLGPGKPPSDPPAGGAATRPSHARVPGRM